MKLLIILGLSLTAFGQGRINAGGPVFTDALGQLWQADAYFTGGSVATGPIQPGTPGYYTAKRYGDFSYLLPVPAGQYTVALGFLENVVGPGSRVFSVSINGATVLTNYDIAADVGQNVPVRKVFPVTVTNSGIRIRFVTVTRSAVVNAIEFWPASILGQCEDGLRTAGGVGGLFPGPYLFASCENLSNRLLQILRFRCTSDVAGQVADLQAPDAGGTLQTLLTATVVCSPAGTEGVLIPGASFPPGMLWWSVRIVQNPNPPVVKQVILSVLREYD